MTKKYEVLYESAFLSDRLFVADKVVFFQVCTHAFSIRCKRIEKANSKASKKRSRDCLSRTLFLRSEKLPLCCFS